MNVELQSKDYVDELSMLRFFAKKYVPVHILDSAYIELELRCI